MTRSGIILLLFFLISATITNGQDVSAIQSSINQVARHPNLKSASFSVCVLDIEEDKVIASHEQDHSVTPASTLKAITTSTALAILGSTYQFQTDLLLSGEIGINGELEGDIIIKGTGDPTLGSDQMEGVKNLDEILDLFADKIIELGIKEVSGQILGDGTLFDSSTTPDTWEWADIGNYYGAGVSGLNIHENLYYLDFALSSSMGKGPQVKATRPKIPFLIFHNELKSAGRNSGDQAYIFGAPYTYTRHIRGSLPLGPGDFTIKGSLPDPPFICAFLLMKKLESKGVLIKGGAASTLERTKYSSQLDNEKRIFFSLKSPELSAIVKRANKESVNVYCEALLKTIASRQEGEGTIGSGTQAIKELWQERGINMEDTEMKDGSGLSAGNKISAFTMASILRKVKLDENIFDPLFNSLPVAGQDGTLENLLKGSKAEGRLRAKSGSMGGVRAYCGYFQNPAGKWFSFAIIANSYKGSGSQMKAQLETIMKSFFADH